MTTGSSRSGAIAGTARGGSALPAEAVVRDALEADLPAILGLLTEAELPEAGVEAALPGFVVAEAGGRLIAAAGLEVHGRYGVLRSVVVDGAHRGRGLGVLLTGRVLEAARRRGLRSLYLLTTTAECFFPRLGFRTVDRADVPARVRESVEFAEACPASAIAMVLELEGGYGP